MKGAPQRTTLWLNILVRSTYPDYSFTISTTLHCFPHSLSISMSTQRVRLIEMMGEGKTEYTVRVLSHKYSQLRVGSREQLPSHQTQHHAPRFDKKWSCELETQIQLHQYNDKKRSHHWGTSGRAGVSSVRLRLHIRVERGGYPGQPVGNGRHADECAYRLSVKWGTGSSLIAMTRLPVKSPRAHSFIGDLLHFPCARETAPENVNRRKWRQ